MESNKKSFVAAEVIVRTGFSPETIKAIKAAGVREVVVNGMGRIVVRWGDKLVMWDAPATIAGKIVAQKAIVAAGLTISGKGVMAAALPKQPAAAPKAVASVIKDADVENATEAREAEKAQELADLPEEPVEAPKKVKRIPVKKSK